MTQVRVTVSGFGGGDGDGSTTNRAIGVVAEPQVNARSVERVFARAQLPDFFAVGEHRQTHRALAADFLRVRLLPVLHFGVGDGGDFEFLVVGHLRRYGGLAVGGFPAAAARRAAEGEDESVN